MSRCAEHLSAAPRMRNRNIVNIYVAKLNQNLRAVPAAVILKLSGSVMRVFQCTCFRQLIAANQNLRAVPAAVILKLSGSVMRVFQCTSFRQLIAVNQNL